MKKRDFASERKGDQVGRDMLSFLPSVTRFHDDEKADLPLCNLRETELCFICQCAAYMVNNEFINNQASRGISRTVTFLLH